MQSLILEICDCPSAFSFASPKENEPGWISISLRPSLNRPEKPLRFFWTFPAKFGAVQNFRRYSYALRRGRCLHRPLRNSGEFVLLFTFLTQGVFSADIMLSELKQSLESRGIEFAWDESVKDYLVKKSYSVSYGARNLRRTIQTDLEDPIAERIIKSYVDPFSSIKATCEDGKIKLETV